jgi:alanine racemase
VDRRRALARLIVMRCELTIDLGALRANVARLTALAAPARYAAVVKANAYGHGLAPVATALADSVAAFCVYRADEAVALRDAGITTPILVLGPLASDELEAAVDAGAAIALWSEGTFLHDIERIAARTGHPVRVHAKIDTGVTRLGLDAAAAPAALAAYLTNPALDLAGVFTHLAAAEELESAYTLAQLERFTRAMAPLAPALAARGVVRHAAASAAAMLFPNLRLDMIRAGIATYGVWPSSETRHAVAHALELEPALSWATDLVVVRDVEAGRSVGYGCTYRASRPSRIGVLPIGYAEGLPRALSGAGTALVGGRRVPFVGRICMNMSFVDVTDVPNVRTGARVTLVGRDGDERIGANDLADAAGSIGYEILARLPSEIPRVYRDETRASRTASIAAARSSVPS